MISPVITHFGHAGCGPQVVEAAHKFRQRKLSDPFMLFYKVTACVHFTAALCLQPYSGLRPKVLVKVSHCGSVIQGNSLQDIWYWMKITLATWCKDPVGIHTNLFYINNLYADLSITCPSITCPSITSPSTRAFQKNVIMCPHLVLIPFALLGDPAMHRAGTGSLEWWHQCNVSSPAHESLSLWSTCLNFLLQI